MNWWVLIYVLLGAVMAWPLGLLVRRVVRTLRPLRCVQPYRPRLPQSEVTEVPRGEANNTV